MSKQAMIAIATLTGLPLVVSTGLAVYLHSSATEEIAALARKGKQSVSLEKVKKIAGKFQGSVGSEHSSIETIFRNENGKLAGIYESIGANNEKYEGTIDRATDEGNGTV